MKNKKSVMLFSALLILYFHLGVNITLSEAENFIKQISYVGVDMFFFISAYTLSNKSVCVTGHDYVQFIISRFKAVYVKFIIFAIIAAFMGRWSALRLIKTVCGIELFTKGGGAFLWFLPAIMLFYILFPLFKMLDDRNTWVAILTAFLTWMIVALAGTYIFKCKSIFIFWNRIPVFVIGYYFAKINTARTKSNDKQYNGYTPILEILLIVLGMLLAYKFGYRSRLQAPITDMFYVFVCPLAIGLVLLTGLIKENKLINWIGSSTLEMYGIQMTFGYKFANAVVKMFGVERIMSRVCTNVLIFAAVITSAVIVHYLYSYCKKSVESTIKVFRR